MDRVVSMMKEQGISPEKGRGVEVCILQLGEKAKDVSKNIYDKLSEKDVNVYFVPSNDSLRAQMRQASKLGATYAVIIGQKEAFKDEIILRDLRNSSQETLLSKDVAEEVKKRLSK
jgi:histidyl-tRNA synthetase